MSERPTPETDAEVIFCHGIPDGFNLPERSYVSSKFARKLERERDEAREALKHIEEYGTEEINAAVELRQKLAQALVDLDNMQDQRDLAIKVIKRLERERDEARAVAGAMADIAFKHLTSLLASTPHSKDAAHDEETQQVIAEIKRWKELKQ